MSNNKDIARRIVDEGWNRKDRKILVETIAVDSLHHDPQDPIVLKGPEGAIAILERYTTAFPDVHLTIEKEIAEGDYVVQHLHVFGTNTGELMGRPATGKKINITGVMTSKFKNGKVVETWSTFDNLGLMQQLGIVAMPQLHPTREPELAGAR